MIFRDSSRRALLNLFQRKSKARTDGADQSFHSEEAAHHESFTLVGPRENLRLGNGVRIDPTAIIDVSAGGVVEIGDKSIINRLAMLAPGPGGHIKLGKCCSVNPFTVLYGHGGLEIGDWVRIATHTVIIPANHIFDDANTPVSFQGLTKKGIRIGNDVWIGCGVRILDGVEIGHGSILAAGAVVTKSCDPMSILAGVPAVRVGERGKDDMAANL